MDQIARIDARIPASVKEIIDFAASLEGRTRTDFLIAAATDRARKVIAESQLIQLSLQDQRLLAQALEDGTVRKPDEFLKNLASLYRDTVTSK